ncbi:hypothetical protein AVL50_22545 [Flammeovirga sp. SJP92]|nr:hypothetical protein AVL50_22545 [Flammeovirga sp. SJP92]
MLRLTLMFFLLFNFSQSFAQEQAQKDRIKRISAIIQNHLPNIIFPHFSSNRMNQGYKYKVTQSEYFEMNDSGDELQLESKLVPQYNKSQITGYILFVKSETSGELVEYNTIELAYNDKLLSSMKVFNEFGELELKEEFLYNEESLLVKIEHYFYESSEPLLSYVHDFEYNNKNQVIKTDYTEGENNVDYQTSRMVISYNQNGNVSRIEKSFFNSDYHQEFQEGSTIVFDYNDNGTLHQENVYYSNSQGDTPNQKSEYEYVGNELIINVYYLVDNQYIQDVREVYEFTKDFKRTETVHYLEVERWKNEFIILLDHDFGELEYCSNRYSFYRYSNGEFNLEEKVEFQYAPIEDGDITNIKSLEDELIVYPNPASNTLYLKNNTLDKSSTLLLINTIGTVYSFNNVLQGLDISHLNKGIYIYKLIDKNDNQKTGKVVIQ